MAKTLADVVAERCKEEEEEAASAEFSFIQIRPAGSGSRLTRLKCMSLDRLSIQSLAGAADLAKHCPILTDLDLSHNQLTSWSEVYTLLQELPSLRQLNVGFNPFEPKSPESSPQDCQSEGDGEKPEPEPTESTGWSHAGVRTLVLNGTRCPWPIVHQLMQRCPSVEELHLSCNGYETVDTCGDQCPHVKRVYFNDNCVSQWQDLEQLCAVFPELTMLVARANPLCIVQESDAAAAAPCPMSTVVNIVLSEAHIGHVDELFALERRCPGMKELRMQDVPLISGWPDGLRREFLIACLPQLTRLNGSSISEDDSDKAERAFVRHFRSTEDISGGLKERFDSLAEKHGHLQPFRNVKLGLPTEGGVNLNVTWFYDEKAECRDHTPVPIRISLMSNLLSLRQLAAEVLGVDQRLAERMDIYYKDGDDDTWSELRDSNDRPLYRLFIENNGDVLVKRPPVLL